MVTSYYLKQNVKKKIAFWKKGICPKPQIKFKYRPLQTVKPFSAAAQGQIHYTTQNQNSN
jgi:hypothetical protein